MAPVHLAPPDFSKTQRLVLLVDLHPLLAVRNPSSYIAAVICAADRLLRFPPLSASLSAFKLFLSSLSPHRAEAVLPRHLSTTPTPLSFNLAPQTLDSLYTALNFIPLISDLQNEPFSSRASYTASSLVQLIHDSVWETEKKNDSLSGEDSSIDSGFMKIPSNMVILFSPISQSVDNLVDYLEMRDFDEVYCAVKEAFAMRDIRLCWVDVKADALETEVADIKKNDGRDELLNLRNFIEKMGWGFCSSDMIVLGSALLPLGLIYPRIGVSFIMDYAYTNKIESTGELSLEILDVHGMPLECKFCHLEFVKINSLPCTLKNGDILSDTQSRDQQSSHDIDGFFLGLGEGRVKVHVKSVCRYDEYEITGGPSEILLVREFFHVSGKIETKSGNDFLADRVLDMLHEEKGGVTCTKQLPTWQMFLSFLHIQSYLAFVSLLSNSGDALMGCLKPLTAHLAILYVMDGSHVIVRNTSGSNTKPSTSGNCIQYRDGKMRKSQRNLYQKMTWNSFCKAAFERSNLNLIDFYRARYENSKRLKFLTCWMKQISKVDVDLSTALPGSNSVGELAASNAFLSKPSTAEDEAHLVPSSETSEKFFNNLSQKMQHGLESGMDLQSLAEHVVKSSVHWLSRNCEIGSNSERQQLLGISDDSQSDSVGKLVKQLLKSPKEMKDIHQDLKSCSTENIIRIVSLTPIRYELQIFLRIEILRSEGVAIFRESRKKKLMKQICYILEIIQYLIAGGVHGHVSLYDYVERTIRARYIDKVEDIVEKIYKEMDLLPFGDEEQTPILLFNSEDSDQSWRDKCNINERVETNNISHSFSTEGETSQLPINNLDSPQEIGQDEYTRILHEAHERREQARRRAPFVGKARDLQRVWAPKLPNVTKGKFCSGPSKYKRKKDRE
ncbi:leucine-rich repeat receptor-like protein kinasePEPR2 [Striga asiatica]|uniref:Leucine-rich repeat receptor-like protein kinasePEPR2 n=1 Tax=Striga asiatica TaxID=4170 RepID=A0A5A7PPD9_STRAF|nr:leucine-rich repeat receptor-like protein kinasePEPR2 [Striga asiatica]